MTFSEQIRFDVIASGLTAAEIESVLGECRAAFDANVSVQTIPRPHFRGVDPVVLAAIIAASGAALAALVTGLLAVAKNHQYKKITIRDGDRLLDVPIEVLEGDGLERLAALVEKIKAMGRPQIVIEK